MPLSILYAALFALSFRYIRGHGDINGDGVKDIPRWVWVLLTAAFCYAVTLSWFPALCWFLVCLTLGTLPTHNLFSAIHGKKPSRKDSWYVQWMQDAALEWKGKSIGIAYGYFRTLPAFIPSVILMGYYQSIAPLILFAALSSHGWLYYASGLLGERNAVARSELALGAILGFGIVIAQWVMV